MQIRKSDPLYWGDAIRWAWIFGLSEGRKSATHVRKLILESKRTSQPNRGQYICKGDGVIFGKRRRQKS